MKLKMILYEYEHKKILNFFSHKKLKFNLEPRS